MVIGNFPPEEEWIDRLNHFSRHNPPIYQRSFEQRAIICHRCGEEGHKRTFCQEPKLSEEELNAIKDGNLLYQRTVGNKTCFLCKQKGHYAGECPSKLQTKNWQQPSMSFTRNEDIQREFQTRFGREQQQHFDMEQLQYLQNQLQNNESQIQMMGLNQM